MLIQNLPPLPGLNSLLHGADLALSSRQHFVVGALRRDSVEIIRLQELARVPDTKDDKDQEHRQGVEDEEHDLVRDDPAIVALEVLGDADDVADEDQGAGDVENHHVLPPRHGRVRRLERGHRVDAFVEGPGYDHEDAEDQHLEDEPAHDDPAAEGGEERLSDGL